MEDIFIRNFDSYLNKAAEEQQSIVRFLKRVATEYENIKDPGTYFGNPLNTVVMISRFANNWKHEVFDVIASNHTFTQYQTKLNNELDEYNIEKPTMDDLQFASYDILNMQEIHNLNTSELANAVLSIDEETGENSTLSASDCYMIGRSLYELQNYSFATEWLQQARQHASNDGPEFPTVNRIKILEDLVLSLNRQRSYKLASKVNKEILKSEPTHARALINKVDLQNKLTLERIKISNLDLEEDL
ncbi:GH17425 [Drosophila grimshawi]|uniref:GH17425 n=2 Tax=Drosophila grimshawi TaxID=7222 RepID=B4JV94_DROGR|nr:GH17425 [Drosophila grimshawi]